MRSLTVVDLPLPIYNNLALCTSEKEFLVETFVPELALGQAACSLVEILRPA